MSDTQVMWAARGAGAFAGSAISLAYMLPVGRREAALRFFVGLTSGMVFGGLTGLYLTRRLGVDGLLSPGETMIAGSALTSLSAWWMLGFLMRLMSRSGVSKTRQSISNEKK